MRLALEHCSEQKANLNFFSWDLSRAETMSREAYLDDPVGVYNLGIDANCSLRAGLAILFLFERGQRAYACAREKRRRGLQVLAAT